MITFEGNTDGAAKYQAPKTVATLEVESSNDQEDILGGESVGDIKNTQLSFLGLF